MLIPRVRGLRSKWQILCGCMGKITLNIRRGQVKTLVFGKSSYWEFFPRKHIFSWKEAARVELISHQLNANRMKVVRYIVCIMACLRNVVHLNIFHGNCIWPARGVRRFLCEKWAVGWRIMCYPQGRGENFGIYWDLKDKTWQHLPIYDNCTPF